MEAPQSSIPKSGSYSGGIELLKSLNICDISEMRDSNIGKFVHALLIIGLLAMAGCETIESVTKSKLPTVKASDAKIAAANFNAIDFLIDLEIQNPNAFGLSLSGFDYDLQINKDSFLTGAKSEALRLEANQSSKVAIPMSLPLQELATKIPDILKQDTFDYAFAAQLQFDMPLVGTFNVPIRKTGTLPVIRPPKIKDLKLAKKGINLTGADLELNLNIENPNNFDLQMKQFQYSFMGNDQSWASGTTANPVALTKKGDASLSIPIRLNFLAIGKTAFQLLTGGKEFSSKLTGNLTVDSSLKYLPETVVPIDFQKSLSLK